MEKCPLDLQLTLTARSWPCHIPGEYLKKQNLVGVRLYVDRKGCENAEFDIAKSIAACSSYMAQITQSCSKDCGVIKSAGCGGCSECVD